MRFLAFFWFVVFIGSFSLWLITRYTQRKLLRLAHKVATVELIGVLAAPVVTAGGWYWYTHRPLPDSTQEVLYEGVTYTRDVRQGEHPVIAHVVQIDLDAPGVAFLVTPGSPGDDQEVTARRTTDFLDAYDLQVAINGDFFDSLSPDQRLRPGDPLDVKGFASSEGAIYSSGQPWHPTLYLSSDNRAQFNEPPGEVYNAISGDVMFLQDGVFQAEGLRRAYHRQRHPRTAVALDADARTLILIAVDGRQPNYSEGVTLEELAEIVQQYGGVTAMNLDGGGSTTLVAEGNSGQPLKLNSPMYFFPGRERPVANHLGVYAVLPQDVEAASGEPPQSS